MKAIFYTIILVLLFSNLVYAEPSLAHKLNIINLYLQRTDDCLKEINVVIEIKNEGITSETFYIELISDKLNINEISEQRSINSKRIDAVTFDIPINPQLNGEYEFQATAYYSNALKSVYFKDINFECIEQKVPAYKGFLLENQKKTIVKEPVNEGIEIPQNVIFIFSMLLIIFILVVVYILTQYTAL